jgi:hypothetical protein
MEILIDSFIDTVKLVPLLGLVYFLVGFLEYRYGDRMGDFITRFGPFGPVAGAIFGCIPQCGFSVVASALYVKRLITPGTLLAVFLSTSDEAVPVFLSIPGKIGMVASLIVIKVAIAVTAGIIVDLLIRRQAVVAPIAAPGAFSQDASGEQCGCCSHGLSGKLPKIKALVLHPLLHTAKIFVFLFILAAVFNFAMESLGEGRISSILLRGSFLQPFLTAFIGLVPSCFTSVLLAGLYIKGVITFGSLVAGLSAGCGLGLLVLIKENQDRKDTLRIIGLLLAFSILAGVALSVILS